jgi:hypothetical protein
MGPLPLQDKGVRGWPSCLATAACPLPAYQWGVFIHTGGFKGLYVKVGDPCLINLINHNLRPMLGIRTCSIRMFHGLPEPDPDPLVRGMDPGIRIRIRISTKMSQIPTKQRSYYLRETTSKITKILQYADYTVHLYIAIPHPKYH